MNIAYLKIIIAASIIVYLISAFSITKNKFYYFFAGALLVHIAKDIVFLFYPLPIVVGASEIVIFFLFILWMDLIISQVRESSKTYLPNFIKQFLLFNLVIIVFFIAIAGFIYYRQNMGNIAEEILHNKIIFICLSLLNAIFIVYALDRIKNHGQEEFEDLNKIRNIIKVVLIIPIVINIKFGYESPVMSLFVTPASFFLYAFLGYYWQLLYYKEKSDSITYLSNEVDAIFEFLQKMGKVMKGNLELESIFKAITDSAVKNIAADAASILMINEETGMLEVKAVTGYFPPPYATDDYVTIKRDYLENFYKSTPIKLEDSILGAVFKNPKPVLIFDCTKDERMDTNTNKGIKHISSIMIIPINISGKTAGIFSVVNTKLHKHFSRRDFNHINIFVENASLSIENFFTYLELLEKHEIEREIGIAAEIQRDLIPEKIPEFAGATLAAYSEPAKGVSGDYYDVYKLDKDKIAIVVCDVAGKGVPAALVMVMIRSIFRLIANPKRTAGEVVSWINKGIAGNVSIDRYATMSVLVYDQKTREASFTNAAHFPLLIYRKSRKQLEEVDTQGLPIGIDPKGSYGQKKVKFHSGDVVFFCTDGITEAVNKDREQYGLEQFKNIAISNIDLNCNDLIKEIKEDISRFVGKAKQHDDQTLLLMKIK